MTVGQYEICSAVDMVKCAYIKLCSVHVEFFAHARNVCIGYIASIEICDASYEVGGMGDAIRLETCETSSASGSSTYSLKNTDTDQ